jgi:hypothetical protein
VKVIEQMLSRYARAEGHHALREVMQEIAPAGLQRAGFFAVRKRREMHGRKE